MELDQFRNGSMKEFIHIGYYCWLRYERNNNMRYCLCSRNWIFYIWTGLTIGLQLQDRTMAGEQTPGDTAALEALKQKALATKKSADDAQAALNAADPSSVPPPFPGPQPTQPPGIDLVTLEALMASAIRKSTEGLRDGIEAVTRENTTIKASQARLESQRRRVNDVGKSEGKTVSLAKQLDFTEDLIAALDGIKELALGIVLDKPDGTASPAGPASPSQAVCKITDCKDGALMLERLDELLVSTKAKLKELTIVWSAPSYRIAFEAIRGGGNSDLAMGVEAMKDISEAAARVERDNKRKEQTGGWGAPATKSVKTGGWGSGNYSAPAQDPAPGGWGQGNGNGPASTWNGGKGPGKGGKGKGGKALYPPAGGPPPASFGGNAAPAGAARGRPGYNECAYCRKEGHYKDSCPELLAQNAKWNNGW
jgi:hypothetical protein